MCNCDEDPVCAVSWHSLNLADASLPSIGTNLLKRKQSFEHSHCRRLPKRTGVIKQVHVSQMPRASYLYSCRVHFSVVFRSS